MLTKKFSLSFFFSVRFGFDFKLQIHNFFLLLIYLNIDNHTYSSYVTQKSKEQSLTINYCNLYSKVKNKLLFQKLFFSKKTKKKGLL